MASFVMSQITTGESIANESGSKTRKQQNRNVYIFKIINDKSLTAQPDEYGPGLDHFSSNIKLSSIPVVLADLISRKLLTDYVKECNEHSLIQSENNTLSIAEILKNMDLNFMVEPASKPQELIDEEENIINLSQELLKYFIL